ncbi:hypothetical protein BT67DRAFT_446234 [Trichocladium antarcticum]|uniref:Uncharacterized protein n=1 Tax=Trichocladium antarcticum TaxID=1450529 RepID=A0AAN6UBU6_9PEZI|nr:hypothetical protein BT67DRAFT_446234 [Trichocladium antarcticum]
MEQIRRRRLERTQYRMLKTLWQHLDFHSPDTLDDAALNDLGVVRGADLDVDNPSPLDFEPRFFAPCHGEISGLEEELETWGPHWRPSQDKPERLRDDEWIRNAGYTYAEMRLEWFDNVFLGLGMEYEGEIHPINIYKGVNQEDMSFGSPIGDCRDNGGLYLTGYYKVPTAADTPHLGITMLNPTVAPEGKMLESELKAAVACLWEQTRSKQFTDHHTKPVIVFTFQSETHARITQAHLDSNTNEIIVRQSRQFELIGGPREPPADAYLLIRWLLNSPIGATKYGDEQLPSEGEIAKGAETGGAKMPVVPRIVVVKSG